MACYEQVSSRVSGGSITYSFVPQSFTKAYLRAWQTTEPVYLVIEEINRGNCAQIFGDLFQLLDRKCDGFSEYPIKADNDLATYIAENLSASIRTDIPELVKSGEELVLPSNLYIWATMNTSDQSLFPIDSAFKRRWDWKYVPIGYKNEDWVIEIGVKKYKWVDFQRKINDKIYSIDNSEDKLLGDFFVDANRTDQVISSDTLLNKILFYIWNDVCKDDPDQIFRWKDDKDSDREKSIRFSDFFCEEDERIRKLQGLMSFLGVIADGESEKEIKLEISDDIEVPDMGDA
jgi:5-methylcytosine-specific restriction endonuclease McrBC GTP-binding regulatory subunit McrB